MVLAEPVGWALESIKAVRRGAAGTMSVPIRAFSIIARCSAAYAEPWSEQSVAGRSWRVDPFLGAGQGGDGAGIATRAKPLPFSWVADDLTEAEQRAIGGLAQIHGLDPTVARTVAGLAWVVDDMTSIEQRAVESLYRAAASDRAYAQTIIGPRVDG